MKFFIFLVVIPCLLVDSEASCTYHARLKRAARSKPETVRDKRSLTCDTTARYRTMDGTCNNLDNPDWGSTHTTLLRLQEPVYSDSIGLPRSVAKDGSPLPHPRAISNHVHFELSFTSNKHSTFVMQWGQFIDHDITQTPQVEDNGAKIDCCARADSVTTDPSSPCFRIDVPNGDPYYNDNKCMNFVRSEAASGTGTDGTPRQQYNGLTAFIDGSMIYGTSDTEMMSLRDTSSNSGLMKVKAVGDVDFLPEGPTSDCFYNPSEPQNYCFLAGDDRVNVFYGLSGLHTLFLREHNRIATEFKEKTTWDDEKIFQETRRIIAAELQVITYREWLPLILGDAISTYNLGDDGYSYDKSINPSLSNVFSTAGFRFGHSQIPNNFTVGNELVDTAKLFKKTQYVIDSMSDVMSGLASTAAQRADAWYVDGMRNKMFETDAQTKDGYDIVALNIQRGRDHGLKPYNDWREYCGLGRITAFRSTPGNENDFGNIQAKDLEETYNDVDDIDLYSGGIAEKPFGSAAVGRTYMCLIGQQFERLRDGDRFWYKSTDANNKFTDDQIIQLEKRSLSNIICDNTDVVEIQRAVFRQPGNRNVAQSCSQLKNKLALRPFWNGQ